MAGVKRRYSFKISSADKPLMIAIRRSKRADGTYGVFWCKNEKWADMAWELTMELEPEAMIVQLPQKKSIQMVLIVEFESDGATPPQPVNNAIGFDVAIVPDSIKFESTQALFGDVGEKMNLIATSTGPPVQETCICPNGEPVCEVQPGQAPNCMTDCVAR